MISSRGLRGIAGEHRGNGRRFGSGPCVYWEQNWVRQQGSMVTGVYKRTHPLERGRSRPFRHSCPGTSRRQSHRRAQ